MWVTDLVIEKERRKQRFEIVPEEQPATWYLDIEGFLKRQQMRQTKERK